MKKHIGAICSAVASLFTFIFLAIPAWGMSDSLETKNYSGYKLISEKEFDTLSAWSRYRIFAIILIVLAIVLALYAIFMFLVNLKVVKVEGNWIELVNKCLLTALVVVSILALISVLGIVGDMAKEMGFTVKQFKDWYYAVFGITLGTKVGLWFVAITNALACVCAWVLPKVTKKN